MKLYRAVSEAEYEQLIRTKQFAIDANSLEGKWFAEQLEHVLKWGILFYETEGFRLIELTIDDELADQFYRIGKLDGIGAARFATIDQLHAAVFTLQGIDEYGNAES